MLTRWQFTKEFIRKAFERLFRQDTPVRFSHRLDKIHELEELHQVSLSDCYPGVARREPGESRSEGTDK